MIIANALLQIVLELLNLYWWVVFLAAIVSNLVAFNVINTRNTAVWAIIDILERLTEPALRQIRRFMPRLGGIDLSPLILLLAVSLAKAVVLQVFVSATQLFD